LLEEQEEDIYLDKRELEREVESLRHEVSELRITLDDRLA